MKVDILLDNVHPVLIQSIQKIESNIIKKHSLPFKIFETSRTHERHQELLNKGKTQDIASHHLYNLDANTILYCTAIDYVYFDRKWSWNLRNSTIFYWYNLFGNLVLDCCPELEWGGNNRKSTKYDHFQLSKECILSNLEKYPCSILC